MTISGLLLVKKQISVCGNSSHKPVRHLNNNVSLLVTKKALLVDIHWRYRTLSLADLEKSQSQLKVRLFRQTVTSKFKNKLWCSTPKFPTYNSTSLRTDFLFALWPLSYILPLYLRPLCSDHTSLRTRLSFIFFCLNYTSVKFRFCILHGCLRVENKDRQTYKHLP